MKIGENAQLIKGLKARNRLVFPPMDTLMASEGIPNHFHMAHYLARAYGGFGTIIVESTAVSPEGRIDERDLGLWNDKQQEQYYELTKQIKHAGAIIGIQLNHAGAKSEVPGAVGATKQYQQLLNISSRLANQDDLKKIKNDFISATKRAKLCGFDFVEIHAAHGYFLSELIHPEINDVIDSDNILERAQLVVELVQEMAKIIPIGIRFSGADGLTSNFGAQDFKPLVKEIEKHVQYFHISGGQVINDTNTLLFADVRNTGENLPFLPHTNLFRQMTNKKIIAVNRYRSRNDVQRGLDNGFDFIAIGRHALFNPSFVLTDILTKQEIIGQKYHWNDNRWWDPVLHAQRYKNS